MSPVSMMNIHLRDAHGQQQINQMFSVYAGQYFRLGAKMDLLQR